jgi:hypothetical protein
MRKDKKIAITGIIIIIGFFIIAGYSFFTMFESISTLSKKTESLQTELNENKQVLADLNSKFMDTQNDKRIASENLNKTIEELQLRQSGNKYTLHDPLYWTAQSFLSSDSTDKKPYDNETFTCANYAQEINNNAEKIGIRCAYVVVNFSDSEQNHALIAFESTDKGLKFFEPQTDERVNLQIGKSYWADCVIPNGNYYYVRTPGDTIQSFTIYW